jgi:hypothetical protein
MIETKFNAQVLAYLTLQIVFVLILCLLSKDLVITSSIIMLLLGITVLMHSNKLISNSNWTTYNIYNFIIIIITIFFVPAYAVFRSQAVLLVGIAIIIANLVAILLTINLSTPIEALKAKSKEIKASTIKRYNPVKNSKKIKSSDLKIVAIKGGSKFHSLDCKMVENKSKKRLKFYYSAHDAQKDGLKPCKLCKAVSYLHQF